VLLILEEHVTRTTTVHKKLDNKSGIQTFISTKTYWTSKNLTFRGPCILIYSYNKSQ